MLRRSFKLTEQAGKIVENRLVTNVASRSRYNALKNREIVSGAGEGGERNSVSHGNSDSVEKTDSKTEKSGIQKLEKQPPIREGKKKSDLQSLLAIPKKAEELLNRKIPSL